MGKTIMERRDGDLYAAIPDNEIGKCRYIMLSDFGSRAEMDASLERGLEAHKVLMAREENGGVGTDPYITDGFHRERKAVSKLELGTYSEVLSEMVGDMKDIQTFDTVVTKAAEITRWLDLSSEFLQENSTKLGESVQKLDQAT